MKKNVKAKYVDGFILVVPKNMINAYLRLARMCSKLWLEHSALEYNECVGDDLKVAMGIPFPKMIKINSRDSCLLVDNI